jgi:hypothetical protein
MTLPLTRAVRDVIAERERQITEEGWTAKHDDTHEEENLAEAASCYAIGSCQYWPWRHSWWKPSTRRRDMVKAAALLLAAIEQYDRLGRTD